MKGVFRLFKRKRHVRRMFAAAFLLIAFIEIGSHVICDSEDIAHFQTLGFCGINHGTTVTIDIPTKQKPRGPSSNLLDEMTIHAVILSDLTAPCCGISYWTSEHVETLARPLSGIYSPPFHPPKLA